MLVEELKKQIRATDLAVSAGRKRQSPRTGLIHLFPADETAVDTIPLYENFCFALALFRQKTVEAVMEGKELLDRLLAFQAPHGNFPIYLHDFPRCWDPLMPLKIAPLLILMQRYFGAVLGEGKLDKPLRGLLDCAEKRRAEKPYSPLWENRFLACTGQPLLPIDTNRFSVQEWGEWLLTAQIAGEKESLSIPFNSTLEAFVGIPPEQERGEPRPCPIEWVLAGAIASPRLLRDHHDSLHCAPLFPVDFSPSSQSFYTGRDGTFRLLWKGKTLHSLAAKASRIEAQDKKIALYFDLSEEMKIGREDLFEAAFFVDFSPETALFIEGKKGTLFRLGETVSIQTPSLKISIRCELLEGKGDFCGHLFRANRPSQIACKGPSLYETYDWQIGLRTLRRSTPCHIRITLILENNDVSNTI